MPAEVRCEIQAFLGAVEHRAPLLELADAIRCLLRVAARPSARRSGTSRRAFVSRKWTFQLSRGSTLPIAAAMPPSAITGVCLAEEALRDHAVLSCCPLHAIAARSPAPPAPITITSCSMVWSSETSSAIVTRY